MARVYFDLMPDGPAYARSITQTVLHKVGRSDLLSTAGHISCCSRYCHMHSILSLVLVQCQILVHPSRLLHIIHRKQGRQVMQVVALLYDFDISFGAEEIFGTYGEGTPVQARPTVDAARSGDDGEDEGDTTAGQMPQQHQHPHRAHTMALRTHRKRRRPRSGTD